MMKTNRIWRTVFSISLLLLAATTVLSMANDKKDWPRWRGNSSDGTANHQMIETGKQYEIVEEWRQPLGFGYSMVSVANGLAIALFSGEEWDYAATFDATTGELRWKQPLDSIYKGHDGSHDGPIATPCVGADKVFALSPWGKLVAFDLHTGQEAWATNIRTDHAAEKPLYGFSSSPVLYGNTVIIEVNGQNNNAIMGFDAASGSVRWSALKDTVMHQSPMLMEIDGQPQLIAITAKRMYGMNPETGAVLWQYKHDGDGYAISSGSMNPVPAGNNRFFLNHKARESMMVSYQKSNETLQFETLWANKNIRMTYATPVYHEGYLYGFSNRFLTCIDAQSGESVWKSREPGDGFITLLDGHLVIVTKTGSLHIAKATPDGYAEAAGKQVFKNHAWAAPSIAYGKIYARSFGELVCLELRETAQPVIASDTEDQPAGGSQFGQFLTGLKTAADKTARIDAFLAAQSQFPIIENGETVHFVFRGKANDMALVSDYFGDRHEEPMLRVPDTDLFYYSIKVPSDTRMDYHFIRNFEERILDSLNQRQFDNSSWFAMPQWRRADYLEAPAGTTGGTLDSLMLESKITETTRKLSIYLPAGYAESGRRYPVIYVNWGEEVLAKTQIIAALDNLCDSSIEPVIAVFVPLARERRGEFLGDNAASYVQMVAEEIVPLIDKNYRTIAEAGARLNVGIGYAGHSAIYAALKHPDVFTNVATQSVYVLTRHENELVALMDNSDISALNMYMDWGNFDPFSKVESWDIRQANKDLAKALKTRGCRLKTRVVNDGFSWLSWQNRTGELLATFFPKK